MIGNETYIRLTIRSLFEEPDYLDLYVLHIKYKLSPGQIVDAVTWLETNGFASRCGMKARLTPKGREWVLTNRFKILRPRTMDWRLPPEGIKVDRIQPNEPYLPDLRQVQEGFFLKEVVASDME